MGSWEIEKQNHIDLSISVHHVQEYSHDIVIQYMIVLLWLVIRNLIMQFAVNRYGISLIWMETYEASSL